jgi:hypothetical protein
MAKPESPLFPESVVDAATVSEAKGASEFAGTENPRYLRVLQALWLGARSRKEIDSIAGAANGPQLIANLRNLGLALPCRLVPGIDRDGHPMRFGVYELDDADRKKVRHWQRKRERKAREAAHGE